MSPGRRAAVAAALLLACLPAGVTAAATLPDAALPDAAPPAVTQPNVVPNPPDGTAAAGEGRMPLWMQSIAESTDCLRSVDANPAFAAVRPRMPTAEAMGLAGIENNARPTRREQEIVVRYAEAAATCVPQFLPDDSDPLGPQVARLISGLWDRQTALLRQLADGSLSWGRYNRESMVLDRQLRRELAAIRKPHKAPDKTVPAR